MRSGDVWQKAVCLLLSLPLPSFPSLFSGPSFSIPHRTSPEPHLSLPVAEGQCKTLVLSLRQPGSLHTVNHQLSELDSRLLASWTQGLLDEGLGSLKPGLLLRKVNLVKTTS